MADFVSLRLNLCALSVAGSVGAGVFPFFPSCLWKFFRNVNGGGGIVEETFTGLLDEESLAISFYTTQKGTREPCVRPMTLDHSRRRAEFYHHDHDYDFVPLGELRQLSLLWKSIKLTSH